MNLDKQIKEMAIEQIGEICAIVQSKLVEHTPEPLDHKDIARLISGHKTKTTFDKCVRQLSDRIGEQMMKSMSGKKGKGIEDTDEK